MLYDTSSTLLDRDVKASYDVLKGSSKNQRT